MPADPKAVTPARFCPHGAPYTRTVAWSEDDDSAEAEANDVSRDKLIERDLRRGSKRPPSVVRFLVLDYLTKV